jgi:hypothetical protein
MVAFKIIGVYTKNIYDMWRWSGTIPITIVILTVFMDVSLTNKILWILF